MLLAWRPSDLMYSRKNRRQPQGESLVMSKLLGIDIIIIVMSAGISQGLFTTLTLHGDRAVFVQHQLVNFRIRGVDRLA